MGVDRALDLIEQRFPQYRSWKFLAPTCTEEVIVGMEGTVARSDLELPAEVLDRHISIAVAASPRLQSLENPSFLAAMHFVRQSNQELLVYHPV